MNSGRQVQLLGGKRKVMGTPAYISPEQARGLSLDWRCDIYSLGGTLHYLLTGEMPFTGKNAKEVIRAHVRKPAPDPRELNPRISRSWAELAQRMMSKDPIDRCDSPEHFRSLVLAALDQGSPRRHRRERSQQSSSMLPLVVIFIIIAGCSLVLPQW